MDKTIAAIEVKNVATPSASSSPSRLSATLVSAAIATLILASPGVHAAALGAITVQSALGEPLQAEVEIPELSSEEASSFNARIASPDAFAAAGVSYNTDLSGARVSLQRRANGEAYLRISTNRAINEPVLGLVLEADWASGQVTRDYTMLLDPPKQEESATDAQGNASGSTSATQPAAPVQTKQHPPKIGQAEQVTPTTTAAQKTASSTQITVQGGDTASEIAVAHGLTGVSLDQMLLAMLRANPNAFIRGNVNLIRAGAVLQMPSAEEARTVSRAEARQTVLAQTRDFEAYRSGLAQNVQTTQEAPGSQSAEGQVEPQVADKKKEQPEADRLEISKGSDSDEQTATAEVALSRQAQEQTERVAELDRNIEELSSLEKELGDVSSETTSDTTAASSDTGGETTTTDAQETPAGGDQEAAADTEADTTTSADSDTTQTDSDDTSAAAEANTATADDETAATDDDGSAQASADPAASDETQTADGSSSETGVDDTSEAEPAADTDNETTEHASADATPDSTADDATEAKSTPAADTSSASTSTEASSGVAMPVSVPAEQPASTLDQIIEYRWPILAILIALLALFGVSRSRRRKQQDTLGDDSPGGGSPQGTPTPPTKPQSPQADKTAPAPLDDPAHKDRTTTTKAAPESVGTSTHASKNSQMAESKAASDDDLVAEADIYIEYGHDEKAEELLNTALAAQPLRTAIHRRLAGIYARRKDKAALSDIAAKAQAAGGNLNTAWDTIAEFGREIDPQNPLYQERPTSSPSDTAAQAATDSMRQPLDAPFNHEVFWSDTEQGDAEFLEQDPDKQDNRFSPTTLDFNLDFTGDSDQAGATHRESTLGDLNAEELHDLADKLKSDATPGTDPALQDVERTPGAHEETLDLDIDFSAPTTAGDSESTPEGALTETAKGDSALIDFDLDDLPAENDAGAETAAAEPEADGDDDPLTTKLALAKEFEIIGDKDGARSLVQEVVKGATGTLKEEAEKFLDKLDQEQP